MLPILIAALGSAVPAADYAVTLPTLFVADRVYAVPRTSDGQSLKLYTDTGGGLFITQAAAQRLKLRVRLAPLAEGTDPSAPQPSLAELPAFKAGFSIPVPPDNEGRLPVMPTERAEKNHFVDDGMLGEAWFGGHVWTWDYPHQHLTLEGKAWKPDAKAARVALGFPAENGERGNNFARITVRIDGKPIDLLLDTGATTTLGEDAMKTLGDDLPAERATSFIVDAQFKEWRTAHPDWRVIEKADRGKMPAIEVPVIDVAGASVGPVWFTWRPDQAFHEYMSGMMDRQVEGALGGNALAHFVMTIDYPGAAAYFRCTRACKGVAQ